MPARSISVSLDPRLIQTNSRPHISQSVRREESEDTNSSTFVTDLIDHIFEENVTDTEDEYFATFDATNVLTHGLYRVRFELMS